MSESKANLEQILELLLAEENEKADREEFAENYPNGNLKSSGVLVNNVKIGSWSYWYQNEVLKESGFFVLSIFKLFLIAFFFLRSSTLNKFVFIIFFEIIGRKNIIADKK